MDQNPQACSDGSCIFRLATRPVGMHTNGGCRCLPLKLTSNDRAKIRQAIRWMVEELESADRRATWIEANTLPKEPGFYWVAGCDDDGWPCTSLFESTPIVDPRQMDGPRIRSGVNPLSIRFVPGQRRVDAGGMFPYEPIRKIRHMTHYISIEKPNNPWK